MRDFNAVEYSTWMDNYIPLIYMYVISYPCPHPHASLVNLLIKSPRSFQVLSTYKNIQTGWNHYCFNLFPECSCHNTVWRWQVNQHSFFKMKNKMNKLRFLLMFIDFFYKAYFPATYHQSFVRLSLVGVFIPNYLMNTKPVLLVMFCTINIIPFRL